MNYIFLIWEFFVFLFGVCIGSFLNCAVYRMEQGKKLEGRSFCPHCKHFLNWADLFPVFSFMFLGGKCRYCKKKISWQYPLVEILTGVIFLLIFNRFGWIPAFAGMTGWAGMIINLIFLFYIASALIFIFIYDLKHYLIPDKVLFPAIFITFLYRILSFKLGFLNYIYAALIASGFFLLIFLFSRGRAMGFGDVKLAVLMGLLLGLPNVLAALFIAFCFGAIIGIILMILRKKGLKSEMPFGPFLITGTFIALLWGPQLINWYLHIIIF